MATTLTIDGCEAPLTQLWRPEMSLSSARKGRQAATYSLAVDRERLLSALSGEYERYVWEGKEDDERMGGPTDALGRAGYPPLEALLARPDILAEVVRGLEQELFAAVLPSASGMMRGTWAIDTIDAVRLDGGRVVVEDTCYRF